MNLIIRLGRCSTLGTILFLSASPYMLVTAQQPDGATIYKEQCAVCHENFAKTRAQPPAALRLMSPENIFRALESGRMKDQGSLLSAEEKRAVSQYLAGKPFGQNNDTQPPAAVCPAAKTPFAPASTDWNGWGAGLNNARFQPGERAVLSADQVPKLKLKWAFAFPDAPLSWAQPIVVGGRIFVPSANRHVYSLDAKTGCQYWTYESEFAARTAIYIAQIGGDQKRYVAFFGDQRANAYALDAVTGELLWKVHVDAHPRAKIVGAIVYFDGRVFVPLTAGEEVGLGDKYECCSARGALIALDAATGKQIWKTYTMEEPKPTTKTAAGVQNWGPSGASIWSAPTIDAKKRIIYSGTGDNFSEPSTKTSDAVLAFDLDTGKLLWSTQLTENDVFNIVCAGEGCGEHLGPDVDIGASPILVDLSNGKRALLISQKSGMASAIDPDQNGKILWQTKVGRGGRLGGIQWGSAYDGKNMYAAVSDIAHTRSSSPGSRMVADPKTGGGLFALNPETGAKVWAAPPPVCGDRPSCSPAQSAAVTVIPGIVFSGGVDGRLRAYSTSDGKVIWDFDTAQEFLGVNGVKGKGGAMDGAGPTVAGGMLFVGSGYGVWGGLPGNVLLAFSVDGK